MKEAHKNVLGVIQHRNKENKNSGNYQIRQPKQRLSQPKFITQKYDSIIDKFFLKKKEAFHSKESFTLTEKLNNEEVIRRMNKIINFQRSQRTREIPLNSFQFAEISHFLYDLKHKNPARHSPLDVLVEEDAGQQSVKKIRCKVKSEINEELRKISKLTVDSHKICFIDFEPEKYLSRRLKLINTDSILRRVKLIPPFTSYFSVKVIRHPSPVDGNIAPGNCLEVEILFKGESKMNHLDFLTVISEKGFFYVSLEGLKEVPKLKLENCLLTETKVIIDKNHLLKLKSRIW